MTEHQQTWEDIPPCKAPCYPVVCGDCPFGDVGDEEPTHHAEAIAGSIAGEQEQGMRDGERER